MAADVERTRVREWMMTSAPVVTPATTVGTALRLLREHGLPALPVVSAGRLVGLVREQGLLRFTPSEATTLDVYELREVLDKLTVAKAIQTPGAVVAADMPVSTAAALMVRARAEVVPVVDHGHVAGLLTSTALLAAMLGHEAAAASAPAA